MRGLIAGWVIAAADAKLRDDSVGLVYITSDSYMLDPLHSYMYS
jgi:hypothetical protein